MTLNGSSARFTDGIEDVDDDNLNSLDMGGNVYQSSIGGLNVDVSPIRGLIAGTERAYAGSTNNALTASQTNYIYIDSSGNLQINTSGFPTYGTGSGQQQYFPLAIVTTTVDNVDTITDRRWKFAV